MKTETEIVFESDMVDLPSEDPNALQVPPSFFPGDIDFFCAEIPTAIHCSAKEYHRIKAYSNTFGSSLLKNSPDYEKAFKPSKATASMTFGSVYELYFEYLYKTIAEGKFKTLAKLNLDVAEIADHVAVMDDDWRANDNRAKKFIEDNPNKYIISPKQLKQVMQMLKSALSNKEFPHYLSGDWQTVLLWIEDGLPMKCMIDHLATNLKSRNKLQAGDLKTSKQASYLGFSDSADRYYYDHQAVHYMSGLKHVYPQSKIAPFVWYVCESEEPFGNAIYEMDEVMEEAGRVARKASISLTKDLHKNGRSEFPLYTDHGPDGKYLLSFSDKVLNKRFKLEMRFENAELDTADSQ